MSFTKKILLGLALGVLAGIFLGEIAKPFLTVGEIYIGLLQMTVLPYIVLSLISNIGGISWSERRVLVVAALAVLICLLVLGVAVLAIVPIAFPVWESASFFSTSLVTARHAIDLVALYIPSNPFHSLAENLVPASVLFAIMLGIGIGGIPGKEGLLRGMDVLADGLNQINKMVIKLTPIGIFAIAAGTAGTISLSEIGKLQAYLVTYTVIATTLSFVVLPLLVSAVTPFKYRDLLSIPKDTLITIFATAKIIVVLPQLVENIKELFRRYDLQNEEVDHSAEILLPLAYPFPNLGTFTILMFIPFSAWYLGNSLDLSEQLSFYASAFLSSFVAPIIGIPFLLDIMKIPADMMELFVMSTVYTDRIRVVLGAVHLLSLATIVIAINRGVFKLNAGRLLKAVSISLVVFIGSLLLVKAFLATVIDSDYSGDQQIVSMRWMDRPVSAKQYNGGLPQAEPGINEKGRLKAIEQRGSLRVGYMKESLPFAFRNEDGEVVGFDMEMAHHLAEDLGVMLELVLVEHENIVSLFGNGQVDIVMSGLAVTPTRARVWDFSDAPMDLNLGFLVPDHQRKKFTDKNSIKARKDLSLGVVQSDPAFSRWVQTGLPNATIIDLDSPRAFLRGQQPELDAVVYSAEGGSGWTLIYPDFSIVVPANLHVKVPMAYPTPKGDGEWTRFVSTWVDMKRKNGTVEKLFEHWIGGAGAVPEEPRWSVIRDVLHWVE
ncbi:MAG: cation:dicarboxylase symporter family transporter [Gammaproteobacteria bacterium]|nr:cation:dicarboxylase symporter family transporter [Gammaproteobacteria bacterium]